MVEVDTLPVFVSASFSMAAGFFIMIALSRYLSRKKAWCCSGVEGRSLEARQPPTQHAKTANVTCGQSCAHFMDNPSSLKTCVNDAKEKVMFRAFRKRVSSLTGLSGTFRPKSSLPTATETGKWGTPILSSQEISLKDNVVNLDDVGAFRTDFRPDTPIVHCAWDKRPGTMHNLTSRHTSLLAQLSAESKHQHLAPLRGESEMQRNLRFLRANKWNVDEALENLRDHASFWATYFENDNSTNGIGNIQRKIDPPSISGIFDQESGLIFRIGSSRFGHPVMVARPSRHLPTSLPATLLAVQRTVWSVQEACEAVPSGMDGIVVLYDCKGLSARNFDLQYSRLVASIFQRHFPERAAAIFVINNSWAVQGLWRLVTPLLDPETRMKIKMCGTDFADVLCGVGSAQDTAFFTRDHPYVCEALRAN
jgi:hypothetical protein